MSWNNLTIYSLPDCQADISHPTTLSGAFSNVYKAIDRRSNSKVAIKCVRKFELNHSQVRCSLSVFFCPPSLLQSFHPPPKGYKQEGHNEKRRRINVTRKMKTNFHVTIVSTSRYSSCRLDTCLLSFPRGLFPATPSPFLSIVTSFRPTTGATVMVTLDGSTDEPYEQQRHHGRLLEEL